MLLKLSVASPGAHRVDEGGAVTVALDPQPGPHVPRHAGPVLELADLRVEFAARDGAVPAVRGVDLEVGPGETLALLGESGSGKSVTARAVMGLAGPSARVSAQRMVLDGVDLLSAPPEERRRMRGDRVSMVFQDALSALNPVLTVGDQIAELFQIHRGIRRRAARSEVAELLAAVGIPDPASRARDHPHQFSGGMRQRILIAMAIALRPRLLIADEPTTALDVTVQAQILDLLMRLREEMDLSVLLITHDLGVACEVADRVAVMYHGRIVETGPTSQVLATPSHPYTAALLRSVPQAAQTEELAVIAGSPPPPRAVLPGCSFAPRCSWRIDRCVEERPELLTVGSAGLSAACHRREEVRNVGR
jgi:oligopeptide transport system ATP-binding protein